MDPARFKSAFLEVIDLFAIQTVPGILRCWERNWPFTLEQKTIKGSRINYLMETRLLFNKTQLSYSTELCGPEDIPDS